VDQPGHALDGRHRLHRQLVHLLRHQLPQQRLPLRLDQPGLDRRRLHLQQLLRLHLHRPGLAVQDPVRPEDGRRLLRQGRQPDQAAVRRRLAGHGGRHLDADRHAQRQSSRARASRSMPPAPSAPASRRSTPSRARSTRPPAASST
jgi:hypothetical protein